MSGPRAFAVAETSFEIYVRQKGSDRWMLDSRYATSDKQEAIEDAKEIARQSHIEAVRVVREIHNFETNTTRDTVVFTTAPKKTHDSGPKRRDDDDDDDGPSAPPGRRSGPADEDDGPFGGDDEDAPAPKRGWFKRKSKDEDADGDEDKPVAAATAAPKPPPTPRSPGFRAYMTVVKFVVIVIVSFGFATASTFVYVRVLG